MEMIKSVFLRMIGFSDSVFIALDRLRSFSARISINYAMLNLGCHPKCKRRYGVLTNYIRTTTTGE